MFTNRSIVVLSAALALVAAGICCPDVHAKGQTGKAKTGTQTAAGPHKPQGRSYGISTTTGWRKINGWEQDVMSKDPNLKNWSWLGMQEMEKSYMRLKPGQVVGNRPSIYRRPQHVAIRKNSHPARVVHQAPAGGVYVKPQHVGLPSRESVATSAKLAYPATTVVLAAPKTQAAIHIPTTNVRLASPTTSVRLAAPTTSARLAAPQTSARLAVPQIASKNTSLTLTSKAPTEPKVVTDAMADCGGGNSDDSFESPDLQDSRYGARSHKTYGYTKTAANVRAKLVKKRSR